MYCGILAGCDKRVLVMLRRGGGVWRSRCSVRRGVLRGGQAVCRACRLLALCARENFWDVHPREYERFAGEYGKCGVKRAVYNAERTRRWLHGESR